MEVCSESSRVARRRDRYMATLCAANWDRMRERAVGRVCRRVRY